MYSIETKNLSYSFSEKETVLDNINIQVPEGSIYGFLGPNGAGKTTTLKLVLGLLKKQKGEIDFFNQPFAPNRIQVLARVGSLIESPSIYAQLTARENLQVWQRIYNCPKARIDEVLNIVDLAYTKKKKAGKFSLGMKQRLSIAFALLHEPDILILDEPTNGLDPSGILEIRELLIRINREKNTTIVISSHLLAEIEKLVTHVGIINKGKIIFQGTLNELHVMQAENSTVQYETDNNDRARDIFTECKLNSVMREGKIILPKMERSEIARLTKLLVEDGIDVYEVASVKNDLESIFIDLTKN
jgi:ABC-type multidrug transport system ATPase subunit|tara:strand:+ start:2047 stop:2952 length:906 start_codon:yes stop_codon:yes gene_type:complete